MARYYPNGSNRPKNRDNPLAAGNDNNAALEDNAFSEWLYDDDYDQQKLQTFELLYSTPLSHYMDYLLDLRADKEYMSRNQLEYGDIHDPRKLRQTSSSSRLYRSALNFVSKNVERLFR